MSIRWRAMLSMPFVATFGATTAAAETDWSQVTATANRQGRVNILHNTPPPLGDLWMAEFHKAFPNIEVEATRLGSSELMQRFGTENAAGVSPSDVVMTLSNDTLSKWSTDGLIRTWTPPEATPFDPQYKMHDQIYIVQLIRSSLVSSKTRIREADAPKD